jgi:mono/diheme cytochrome c family protein
MFLAAASLSIVEVNAQPIPATHDAVLTHTDEAAWSVDAADPGPDVPPVGRSLFDFLLLSGHSARVTEGVPFPFSALLNWIGSSSIDAVLIPLGRSLQRNAAAPAFFASPRVVVALDREPRGAVGMLPLKDRLYLGYQPSADAIEVISYNEAAGRFEFQVVTDYRAGGRAKVTYARRVLCMACHQNGGPIFSRGLWSETNANLRVAAVLRNVAARFEGVDVERGVDISGAIDAAIRRANRLAGYQWLWRHGCAALGTGAMEARCRGQAMIAALQYKLSGGQAYDAASSAYREWVRAAMVALASTQRGRGLAIPDPGLPNRDPLLEHSGDDGATPNYTVDANVAAVYDPLAPRPPLETWSWDDPDLLSRRLVAGLAEFFTDSDARRLDAQLYRRAMENRAPRRHATFVCSIGMTRITSTRQRVSFVCNASEVARGSPPRLEGSLLIDGMRIIGGSVDRVTFANEHGEPEVLRNNSINRGSLVASRSQMDATLRITRDGAHVRRGDGSAIENIRLTWTIPSKGSGHSSNGEAIVTIAEDFAPVLDVAAALQQEASADALSARPFRRAAVLAALERGLGLPPRPWCCLDDRSIAAAPKAETVAVETEDARVVTSEVSAFYVHCAQCHRSGDPSPANFLTGTPQQVRTNLAHCAPRLYVRLAMWDLVADDRPKTPMPPMTALHGAKTSEAEWRASGSLATMRAYVGKILQEERGKVDRPGSLSRTNYERLRECVPRERPSR